MLFDTIFKMFKHEEETEKIIIVSESTVDSIHHYLESRWKQLDEHCMQLKEYDVSKFENLATMLFDIIDEKENIRNIQHNILRNVTVFDEGYYEINISFLTASNNRSCLDYFVTTINTILESFVELVEIQTQQLKETTDSNRMEILETLDDAIGKLSALQMFKNDLSSVLS